MLLKVSFGDTTGLSIKRDDPREESHSEQDTIVITQVPQMESKILVMLSVEATGAKVNN